MKNRINLEVKDINTILTQGETSTVEFKSSFQKELIETVVAFANAQGVLVGYVNFDEMMIDLENELLYRN